MDQRRNQMIMHEQEKKEENDTFLANTCMRPLIRVWSLSSTSQHMRNTKREVKFKSLLIRVWEGQYVYESNHPGPLCIVRSLTRMALARPCGLPWAIRVWDNVKSSHTRIGGGHICMARPISEKPEICLFSRKTRISKGSTIF